MGVPVGVSLVEWATLGAAAAAVLISATGLVVTWRLALRQNAQTERLATLQNELTKCSIPPRAAPHPPCANCFLPPTSTP